VSNQPAPLTRATAGALAVGVTLGSLGSNVMPVLLGGITDSRDLSNTAAGGIATAQLLATALAVLALTVRAGRPGRSTLARWGLAAAATGFAASMIAPSAVMLGVTNVLAGAGMGVIGAMALAGLPNTADPDRATKITVFFNVLGVAVMVAAIAGVNALFGPASGFLLIAVVCVGAMPLMGRLPDAPATTHNVRPGLADMPVKARGAALCIGAALFAATDLGLWAHAETLGRKYVHIDEAALVAALTGGVLAGLVGVVTAAWLSGRWRHTGPLVGFLFCGAALKFVIAVTTSPALFAVAIGLWNVTYPAVVLLLLTIAATLDVRGRWNAALGGAIGLGTAAGPLAAGVALDVSRLALGVTLVAGVTVAAAFILVISRSTDRAAQPALADEATPTPAPTP
jgi:predicted MFS family arabinose efflux permease